MNIEDIKVGKRYLVEFIDFDDMLRYVTQRTVMYTKGPDTVVVTKTFFRPAMRVRPHQVICEAPKPWYQFWK